MGKSGLRFFSIGGDDGVVGEDIGVVSSGEGVAGGEEAARIGVEEDEVVGNVGGRRNEGLEVEGVEGFACRKVSLGYACL